MSRSIHRNLSRRQRVVDGYIDYEAVATKHRIKRIERRRRHADSGHSDDLAHTCIVVQDRAPEILYPASRAELAGLLARMSGHVSDGLSRIALELGLKYQRESARECPEFDLVEDPVYRRPSLEIHEGLFEPPVWGVYRGDTNSISMYGVVAAPNYREDKKYEWKLTVRWLLVLLHELGHHEDYVTNHKRGRNWSASERRAEGNADRYAKEWGRRFLLPYLWEISQQDDAT